MHAVGTFRTNLLAVVAILFFWPIGLLVMWRYTDWPPAAKWIVTVGCIVATAVKVASISR